ncbi:MAG: SOS response-associated peptidase [Phenylobacterium sp.]|uniref:SOS response-associated peptidase n=1 Tax=Phenylobacterium sp. TaxID=1871053 RepID=UPI003918D824
MCNAYGLNQPIGRLVEDFQGLMPFVFDEGRIPNLEPREMFRPTNRAPVLRPVDPADPSAGVAMTELRWWLVPFFHKGAVKDWKAMCTNARAETIATTAAFREPFKRRRCIVPASHFFEWKKVDPANPKGEKIKMRISAVGRDVFYFAGLWDRSNPSDHDGPLESFTLATCAPGPDMAEIHNRQPVILDAERAAAWLKLDGPGQELLKAGPAGELMAVPDAALGQ